MSVFVHDYPEAEGKKKYYEKIIQELEGYESAAKADLGELTQDSLRNSVTNNTSGGPYYDVFINQKNKWFDDFVAMKKDLKFFVDVISNRLSDARKLRNEWAYKETLGHWEYM